MKDKQTILKKWYTISEAAKYLSLSQDTLRRWEKKGKLVPKRTMGKHRRYSLKQLKKLFAHPTDISNIKPKTIVQNISHQSSTAIKTTPPASPPPQNLQTSLKTKKKSDNILVTTALVLSILILLAASYIIYLYSNLNPISEPISPVSGISFPLFFS